MWRVLVAAWVLCSMSMNLLAQNPLPMPADYKPPEFVLKLENGGPSSPSSCITFSPNGRELAAVGGDRIIRIWDVSGVESTQLLDAPRVMALFNGHGLEGELSVVRYSPDGRVLAVGSNFGTSLVEAATGDVLAFLQPQPYATDMTTCLAFSPDGRFLVTGHTVNVRVYDLTKFWKVYEGGKLQTNSDRFRMAQELTKDSYSPQYRPGPTFGVEFLAQKGQPLRFVVSTLSQPAVLFEQQNDQWKEIASLKNGDAQPILCNVSPDSKNIFLTGLHRDIEVWSAPFKKPTVFAESNETVDLYPPSVRFSPDSQRVLLAPFNSEFCTKCVVCDLKTGKEVASFDRHTNTVTACAYHPTADLVATAGGTSHEIYLWRPSNGKLVAKAEGLGNSCNAVAFSSDGKRLLFGDRMRMLDELPPSARRQMTETWKDTGNGNKLGMFATAFISRQLTHAFDLEALTPSTLPEVEFADERDTRRATLALKGWSVDRYLTEKPSEQGNHILLIMKNGKEVQRIEREQTTQRINAASLVEIGERKQMGVVVASRTILALHDAETGKMLRRFAGHQGEIMAVAVSPDGSLMASASQDQTVRVWSLLNPGLPRRQLGIQLAEDGQSNQVAKLIDGMPGVLAGIKVGDVIEQVAGKPIQNVSDMIQVVNSQAEGASVDLKIKRNGQLVKLSLKPKQVMVDDTVEPILSLFVARNGQWVAWTSTGHYTSSPSGDSLFGFLVNRGHPFSKVPEVAADFHRAKSFQSVLYSPETVKEHLASKGKPSKDNQVSIKQLLESSSIQVKINSPNAEDVFKKESVEVTADIVHPESTNISAVQVAVNGRLVDPFPRRARQAGAEFKQLVELSPGQNLISVQAVTANGVLSEPATVRVNFNRPLEPRLGVLHVLAIGVSKYRDKSLTLNYSDKDAKDFANAILKQKGSQFTDVKVTVLTDDKATRDGVRSELNRLRSLELGKKDQVVLFLSGHGGQDSAGAYCYLTVDADAARLRETAVAWNELRDAVTAANRQAYIFLDTCHAGGAVGQSVPAAAAKEAYNKVLRAAATDVSGVITIASCLPDEESFENDEWKNGAFTKAIIEAIGGKADVNSNGLLTIAELELYISSRVEQLTRRSQSSCVFKAISVPSNLQIAVIQK